MERLRLNLCGHRVMIRTCKTCQELEFYLVRSKNNKKTDTVKNMFADELKFFWFKAREDLDEMQETILRAVAAIQGENTAAIFEALDELAKKLTTQTTRKSY